MVKLKLGRDYYYVTRYGHLYKEVIGRLQRVRDNKLLRYLSTTHQLLVSVIW